MELENYINKSSYMTGSIKYNHIFDKYMIKTNSGNNEKIIYDNIIDDNIVDLGYDILVKYGFNIQKVDTKRLDNQNISGMQELHIYDNNDINKKNIPSIFDIHMDSDNFENGCSTIIFYLENTFKKGGRLIIYENNEEIITEIIKTKPNKNSIKIILLQGCIFHNMEDIYGIGIRKSIVLQFPNL